MIYKHVLSKEEQEALFKKYIENPTAEVKNILIENNLRLINWVIRKYFKEYPRTEYDDLFQSGVFGLIKAIDTYDPSRGSFATIAAFYIRSSIQRSIFLFTSDVSLDADISEDGEPSGITLGDITPDPNSEELYEDINKEILIKRLREVVRERIQDEKQYNIICLYYGLNGNSPHTLGQIGAIYSLSKEYVRTLIKKALKPLHRIPDIKQLAYELDCYTPFYQSTVYSHTRPSNRNISSPVERLVLLREDIWEQKQKERQESWEKTKKNIEDLLERFKNRNGNAV